MKKGLLLAPAVLGTVGLLVSGFGGAFVTSADAATHASVDRRSAAHVTITFAEAMSSGSQKVALAQLVKEFEHRYPNITVSLMPEPSYGVLLTKEEAAVAAQNPPTIGQAYEDWAADFAQSKAIVPLTPYVFGKGGLTKAEQNDFWPSIWRDQYLSDGQMWMFPFNKSDFVMYYNATRLKQLHQAVPKTWVDFARVSKAATSTAKHTWSVSIDPGNPTEPGNGTYLWMAVLRSFGGHVIQNGKIDFASPAGVRTMEFFLSLYNEGALKLGTNYPGQTALGAQRSVFDLSTVASYPYNVDAVGGKFDMQVAALPSGPAGQGNIMQGTNIVLFAKSTPAQKEAGWMFMNFLAQPEQTAYWAEMTGYLPVRKSADALMKSYFKTHPYQEIAAASLQYARPQEPIPGLQQAVGYIGNAITSVLTQHTPIRQALQQAASQAQQALGGQ